MHNGRKKGRKEGKEGKVGRKEGTSDAEGRDGVFASIGKGVVRKTQSPPYREARKGQIKNRKH